MVILRNFGNSARLPYRKSSAKLLRTAIEHNLDDTSASTQWSRMHRALLGEGTVQKMVFMGNGTTGEGLLEEMGF